MQLERGDLVQLLSGGPVMTVGAVDETVAAVIWFDAQGLLHVLSDDVLIPLDLLLLAQKPGA
jgi:uncharacterized protein YodC (DUF2158 family)